MYEKLNINEIAEIVVNYFQKFIIPNTDMTQVESVTIDEMNSSKGLAFNFKLRDLNYGPTYYIGNILESLSEGHTIEATCEMINIEISQNADKLKRIQTLIENPVKVSALKEDDAIVSIVTTDTISDNYMTGIYRKDLDTGITMFMKAPISHSDGLENVYHHVAIDESLSDKETEALWRNALCNTYVRTPVGIMTEPETPLVFNITDAASFSPLFYTCFNEVYKTLCEQFGFSEMYIIPASPYSATVIGVPEINDELDEIVDELHEHLDEIMSDYAINAKPNWPPALKYDALTDTISKPD